ncbi:MAG: hypothetical protein AB1553_05115 [Nitrospirota bacterium]
MSNEDRRGDSSTLILWADFRRYHIKDNWCCTAIKESGIEFLPVEEIYPDFSLHRIRINFCPHCGQRLYEGEGRYTY